MKPESKIKKLIRRFREDPAGIDVECLLGDIENAISESKSRHSGVEIRKCLVCCTSHVTREVAEKMDNNTINDHEEDVGTIIYSHFEYGWMVRWWPSKKDRSKSEWAKAYHESLLAVIEIAEKNGCNMIQFDNSGPVIDGLPTYNW